MLRYWTNSGILAANILLSAVTAFAAPNIEMVRVPGGCFQMGGGSGDEIPIHEICLNSFQIGRYEVTQAQWQEVMGKNPSGFKKCGLECPVEQVSWNDVQNFIRNLNEQTGMNYRLPTEAEWEYAARSGGKAEEYAGVNDTALLPAFAWFGVNSEKTTHKVGLKKPNGLGIYDMSGNVWEWCQDWYSEGYYEVSPRNNPQGPEDGKEHVTRGGGWGAPATVLRTTERGNVMPGQRNANGVGFRLLLP